MSVVYGVDGTKSGWIVSSFSKKEKDFAIFFISKLKELTIKPTDLVLIDIPLGLPSRKKTYRECDLLARKILKKRACTLFSPPLVEAINKSTYKEALETNRKYANVGFSKQAFNLKPKIIEARNFTMLHKNIYESHPELCFLALNKGEPLLVSKHCEAGIKKRLDLICSYNKELKDLYEKAKIELKKFYITEDDLVDSIVLTISGVIIKANKKNLVSLPKFNELDKTGISLKLIYGSF